MERNRLGYKFYNLIQLLIGVIIFSACGQEEDGLDFPLYEKGDVPISFSIGEWNSRAEQTEKEKYPSVPDPSKGTFEKDDAFGVFAYYLQGGNETQISSLVPNFMYNQEVKKTYTEWVYSPVKYWSNNPVDKFRFCAYYPYNHPTLSLSSNTQQGLPTLTYTMPNDKTAGKLDLLYADQVETLMPVNEKLLLNFKHLLGKIQFKVSVEKPANATASNSDNCELYRALIQAVKFKVNWKGSFNYKFNDQSYPDWEMPEQEERDFLELTANPAGELIENKAPRVVHDFTAFLLPVDINEIDITVNNMTNRYQLQNVEVKAGMVTTLNVMIKAVSNQYHDARFYATFSRWEEGEDLNYDLQ